MCTALDNFALFKHENPVCVAYGAVSMRDVDQCLLAAIGSDPLVEIVFGDGVEISGAVRTAHQPSNLGEVGSTHYSSKMARSAVLRMKFLARLSFCR